MATSCSSTPFRVALDPHPRTSTYHEEFCRRKRLYPVVPRRDRREALHAPKHRPLTSAPRKLNASLSTSNIPREVATAPAKIMDYRIPANAKNGSLWWKNYGPTTTSQILPTFRPAHGWKVKSLGDNKEKCNSTYVLSRPQYSHRPNYLPGGRMHPNHTEYTSSFWFQKTTNHHVV